MPRNEGPQALVVDGSSSTHATSLAVMNKHARTFSWAALFLDKAQRADAAVAYAFFREVDDIVDECDSEEQAHRDLDRMEQMLEGERAPSALVAAYLKLAARAQFGLQPARDLIAGARSDLTRVRVTDSAQLSTYCYRVAGTVGLMMCGILGVKDASARKHAIQLGVAMQLTNICRDVREDALRGRVYLPASSFSDQSNYARTLELQNEVVETARASDAGAPSSVSTAVRLEVAEAVQRLLAEADRLYASARLGFPALPVRARWAVCVASTLYREIGVRLRNNHMGDALSGRVVVPPLRKFWLLGRATIEWLATLVRPVRSRSPRSANITPKLT